MGAAVVMMAWLADWGGDVPAVEGDRGIIVSSANMWIGDRAVSCAVATALTLLSAAGMLLLSRTFNLLRTVSQLDCTFFLCLSLTMPALLCGLTTGAVMLPVILLCLFLLYSAYANGKVMQRIFLLFALLSTGLMSQYSYGVYIPVFLLGLGQMRIFSMRSVLAAVFGLVTPWWIVFGLGIADVSQLHIPEAVMPFASLDAAGVAHLIGVTVFGVLLLLGAWSLNFMKMLSYNAHLRAYNGTLSMLGLFTVTALVADFTNIYAYIPVLFALTAFQLCHLFVNRGRSHTAGAIGGVIGAIIIIAVISAL